MSILRAGASYCPFWLRSRFTSIQVLPAVSFHLSGHALTVLLCHLAYSVSMYVALLRRPPGERLLMASTALDLFFATAVAFVTEGQTSPAYVYFVFAIIAVGIDPACSPRSA